MNINFEWHPANEAPCIKPGNCISDLVIGVLGDDLLCCFLPVICWYNPDEEAFFEYTEGANGSLSERKVLIDWWSYIKYPKYLTPTGDPKKDAEFSVENSI